MCVCVQNNYMGMKQMTKQQWRFVLPEVTNHIPCCHHHVALRRLLDSSPIVPLSWLTRLGTLGAWVAVSTSTDCEFACTLQCAIRWHWPGGSMSCAWCIALKHRAITFDKCPGDLPSEHILIVVNCKHLKDIQGSCRYPGNA